MGGPHAALLPLAAGGRLGAFQDPEALVDSAIEHRMAGLVWSAEREGHRFPREARLRLAQSDAGTAFRHSEIWRAYDLVSDRLAGLGVSAALLKGVASEARWYGRMGERPCSDLDLWLDPAKVCDIEEIVAELEPDHPLHGDLTGLVGRGTLQSVDLQSGVPGIGIDLHVDPFKVGVPTRALDEIWSRTEIHVSSGRQVRVPDRETALMLFLLHLNKDRFRYLLGFADVARIVRTDQTDWEGLHELADREGLWVPVARSLEVVCSTLGLSRPPIAVVRGARARLWDRAWSHDVRLQGHEGKRRYRYRQQLIGFTARGRTLAAARDTLRKALPEKPLFAYYQPGETVGYPTLVMRRIRGWRTRRRALAQTTRGGDLGPSNGAGSTPVDG
jgi:hypothetical protein